MMRYLYFFGGSINHHTVSQYISKSRINKYNVYYDPNDILLCLLQILQIIITLEILH